MAHFWTADEKLEIFQLSSGMLFKQKIFVWEIFPKWVTPPTPVSNQISPQKLPVWGVNCTIAQGFASDQSILSSDFSVLNLSKK